MHGHTALRLTQVAPQAFQFTTPTGSPLACCTPGPIKRRTPGLLRWLGLADDNLAASRPSLQVRCSQTQSLLFKVRQASGMMYDSRRVYDGSSRVIAHIRSGFKSAVSGMASLIDMREVDDSCPDISNCPWYGVVRARGDLYVVDFVDILPGVSISPLANASTSGFDIAISAPIAADPVRSLLAWAVPLTLAWKPPA